MTWPEIEKNYVETGKVKYVFRDLPLESIHKLAFKAHEAANCAGEQGKYWEMHDRLYANQNKLRPDDLPQHAEALGLDMSAFNKCLSSDKYAGEIRADIAEADRAGIRGTPTFLLGRTGPDGSKVEAVTIIRGAQPYSQFQQAFDKMLASAGK